MLGGHDDGDHPTDTSTGLLHGDTLHKATYAQLASLLTAMQDGGDPLFINQAQETFDFKHDDGTDYSGGPHMSDKSSDLFGGSFTSHCPPPMWGPSLLLQEKWGIQHLVRVVIYNFAPFHGFA